MLATNNNNESSGEFEKNLSEILEWLRESLQKGAEFAQEQVPIFIQELITYYTFFHVGLTLLGLVLMFISYKGFMRVIKRNAESYEDYREKKGIKSEDIDDFPNPLILAISGFCGIGGLIVFVHHVFNAIKVIVAPRLYLLEYASSIIEGGGC